MNAWGTLLATIVGAAIALLGQRLAKRAEDKARLSELLMEQCALIASSVTDFEDRIWEERVLGMEGRVSGYDLPAHVLASVRLRILTRDAALLAALDELDTAGKELGSYWRQGRVDDDAYTRLWTRHHKAIPKFINASGEAVRRRLASA
ncbi:hypothetical protein ACFQ7F_15880 [Streptomyces sp. NPDC056486]|uniref:hypothetical protein n=1 Tax=Streptomyces sp. NPDC056486 TaxID=3345835 RepID=UPI0036AEBD37